MSSMQFQRPSPLGSQSRRFLRIGCLTSGAPIKFQRWPHPTAIGQMCLAMATDVERTSDTSSSTVEYPLFPSVQRNSFPRPRVSHALLVRLTPGHVNAFTCFTRADNARRRSIVSVSQTHNAFANPHCSHFCPKIRLSHLHPPMMTFSRITPRMAPTEEPCLNGFDSPTGPAEVLLGVRFN
jgi:hypothetical protein